MKQKGIKTTTTILIITIIAIAGISGYLTYKTIIKPNENTTPPPPHYEIIASVNTIADGDTITVLIENIVENLHPQSDIKEDTSETIRYGGGVDAPETWTEPPQEGSLEAKQLMENILFEGMTVYLDLDELARGGTSGLPYRGAYERLIAVVYVKYSTKWINLNAELIRWGENKYPYHNWLKYDYIESEFDGHQWLEDNYPYVYYT